MVKNVPDFMMKFDYSTKYKPKNLKYILLLFKNVFLKTFKDFLTHSKTLIYF